MTVSLVAPSTARTLNLVLTVTQPGSRRKGSPESIIPVCRPITHDGDLLTIDGLTSLGRNLTRQLCPRVFNPEIAFGHDQAADLTIDDATAKTLFPQWRFRQLQNKSADRWHASEILGMSLISGLCLANPGWCEALGHGSVRAELNLSHPRVAILGLSFKRFLHPLRQPAAD